MIHQIWNLNLSLALSGRRFSRAIFIRENSLGFGWVKSGMVEWVPYIASNGYSEMGDSAFMLGAPMVGRG